MHQDLGAPLVVDGITKAYDGLRVNDAINLTVRAGEVHGLLGENGAGKSTLVGILSGRLQPDAGTIVVNGAKRSLGGAGRESNQGIATVFQELMLVPTMTGLENVALALNKAPNAAVRSKALAVQEHFDLVADLDVPVHSLELPQRQRVELIRALCEEPQILLLDEPTSLLSPTEAPALLRRVRALADDGLAVLFITHRLDEARSVADRISLLRRGRLLSTYERASLPTNAELATEMLGAAITVDLETFPPADGSCLRATSLRVAGDRKELAVRDVDLDLARGEILGVAGVDGNGQVELLEALAGMRKRDAGEILYFGENHGHAGYERLHRCGVQFISGDRSRYGIVPGFTIKEHVDYALGPIAEDVADLLRAYDVRPPHPEHRADQLSGGNQQKMILALSSAERARLLVMAYPTRGLDVRASLTIRQILIGLAHQRRVGIVVTSSDLDELLAICHRIVVMRRGQLVGSQVRAEFDVKVLAQWYTAETTGDRTEMPA